MNYIAEVAEVVEEVMPWDLEEELEGGATQLILEIREPYEFDCMQIDCSSNLPVEFWKVPVNGILRKQFHNW